MLWITTQAKALSVGLVLIPLAFTTACGLPGPRAMVVSVGDGDTIRVRKDDELITVRLACIDAPESAQRPYGQESRRELQQRLPVGSSVRLAEKTTDRYGSLVAEVFRDSNINLSMVEDGQAFAFRQYLQECDAKKYLDAEDRASRQRTGVWQVEGGITRPWDFRRQQRSSKR